MAVAQFKVRPYYFDSDFPQRVRSAKLTEYHANKLAPARHALAAIIGSRLLDQAFKVGTRNELENLTEQAA